MAGADPKVWADLAPPWRAAFGEAWAAWRAGSLPIGAAIADARGEVIARGRNRRAEDRRVDGHLSGHRVAHAELNALLALPPLTEAEARGLAVYSTVEPCPMCLGAIALSLARELHFAAPDPWAGHVHALGTSPYFADKAFRVGRAPHLLAEVCAVLSVGGLLRAGMRPDHGFFAVHARDLPAADRAARALHADGTLDRLGALADPAEALAALAAELQIFKSSSIF